MPRVNTYQSSKKSITNNLSENIANDSSLIHSRSVCRDDLLKSPEGFGYPYELLKTGNDFKFTPSSSSGCGQKFDSDEYSLQVPDVTGNWKHFSPKYDISQKVEDLIACNSHDTPRRLNKPATLFETPAR